MKTSNFDRLIMRYVTRKTSPGQTAKIEAMLKAIRSRKIHFLAAETEELLYQQIVDHKVSPEQIARIVKGFSRLTVPKINWLRIEPFCVHFHKDCIVGAGLKTKNGIKEICEPVLGNGFVHCTRQSEPNQ